jgi:hypothetical protein
MSDDWKRVAAIATNLFVVANMSDMLRVVFGERLNKEDEGVFHGAIQVDREGCPSAD